MNDFKKIDKMQSELAEQMIGFMVFLDDIYCYSKSEKDLKTLWTYRARIQDAVRSMFDAKPLRKNLKTTIDEQRWGIT